MYICTCTDIYLGEQVFGRIGSMEGLRICVEPFRSMYPWSGLSARDELKDLVNLGRGFRRFLRKILLTARRSVDSLRLPAW